MNIIVFDAKTGHTRTLCVRGKLLALAAALVLLVVAVTGLLLGMRWQAVDGELARLLRQDMASQVEAVGRVRQEAEAQLAAMTVRLAELQARMTRLDALGERLVSMARLDGGEFDFSQPPAVGGLEHPLDDGHQSLDFMRDLDRLSQVLEQRKSQLTVLESLLSSRQFGEEARLTGSPVAAGWLSSGFGRRADPFTGRVAWHDGVDFAGKSGEPFVSVSAGIVTWAGPRYGYGNVVEISHGGGYVTRYAHGTDIQVKVGDLVKKGQPLGKVGSTGRSTGPHVHFEVRLNGQAIDPLRYIQRRQG